MSDAFRRAALPVESARWWRIGGGRAGASRARREAEWFGERAHRVMLSARQADNRVWRRTLSGCGRAGEHRAMSSARQADNRASRRTWRGCGRAGSIPRIQLHRHRGDERGVGQSIPDPDRISDRAVSVSRETRSLFYRDGCAIAVCAGSQRPGDRSVWLWKVRPQIARLPRSAGGSVTSGDGAIRSTGITRTGRSAPAPRLPAAASDGFVPRFT